MSAKVLPNLEEFKDHFKENYYQKVETAIKLQNRGGYLYNAFIICFVILFVNALLYSYFQSEILRLFSIVVACILIGNMTLMFIASWKWQSMKVGDKNILAYHLLEASKSYGAFTAEKGKKDFLEKCLKEVESFGAFLRGILDKSRMSLKLTDIAQLDALYDNIMNKIYPALEENKDYLTTLVGRDYGDFFSSMARFFFYEMEYDDLPTINQGISTLLKDTYEPFTPKEGRSKSYLKEISRGFKFGALISLITITVLAFAALYLMRVPQYGPENFWTYIADNAAIILFGILGPWASVLIVLHSRMAAKK